MPLPWAQMIKLAPTILSLANDLRQRVRKMETRSDDPRLQELESELKQQAEVLHVVARQLEGLTQALIALRRSFRLALGLGGAALLLGLAALFLLPGR